ncbi:MAG: hypothetical protein HYY91_00955 [Candidatus Omnitrophica bacterium]|nr:hypothetical protein [Candidatus Omnitrophota bacterium]
MKPNSRRCSDASISHPVRVIVLVAAALLAGVGCESLQKKFIRKRRDMPRPSPIIAFQDYTRAMTPLDRYRKHYMMFDYWNSELVDVLQARDVNPKRVKRASGESLQELKTMQGLLADDIAAQVAPLITEREQIDRRLQRGSSTPSQVGLTARQLEAQTREVHRSLFWRNVEDRLKDGDAPPAGDAGGH